MVQKNSVKKVIIITGQTATGKSDLAIRIAKKYNGEIISADSVQIYKGLDIGSAKESAKTREKIKHHLIDIKEPTDTYNVGEFIVDCDRAIQDILSKDKLPIIVGGTGLYVKALMEGYSLGNTSANDEFRLKMQDEANKYGNQHVWNLLNEINPDKAKSVHFNNLKRVIRYLEIEKFGDNKEISESILKDYNFICVGVIEDREILYERINARVDKMIDMGLIDEVNSLIKAGVTRSSQSTTSIGYKEWFDYLEGIVDLKTTIDLIKQHSRNYAKRQLTFLKTIRNVELLTLKQAEERIEGFLDDRN